MIIAFQPDDQVALVPAGVQEVVAARCAGVLALARPTGVVDGALRLPGTERDAGAPAHLRLPALRPWVGQLRAVLDSPGGGEAFIALLTYIELVSETPASELHDLAASLGPNAEEAYMTTAEQLRTEGRAEGRAEAYAQGRAEALVLVLTVKFGILSADVPEKVRAASSGQVQEWTARAVTAEKLDEVFG